MFGKSKRNRAGNNQAFSSAQQQPPPTAAEPAAPAALEAISSISSGLSIVGKIVGHGELQIFGHVEGELHASTIQISDGARVEGSIVAEELTIGGHVKATIHANRVNLMSTAVVEGDIYHRSLAIEENAQFEGMSRRQESVIDTPSRGLPTSPLTQDVSVDDKGNGAAVINTTSRVQLTAPQAQAGSIDDNPKGNGSAPHGLNS